MTMKYEKSVYSEYNLFCATVVRIVKEKIDKFNFAGNFGILPVVVTLLTGGLLVWWAICLLISMGVIGYYGSIGVFIAHNPIIGGILLGTFGGLVFFEIYKHKNIIQGVDENIVKKFSHEYENIVNNYPAAGENIPGERIEKIDELVDKAAVEYINSLVRVRQISLGAAWDMIKEIKSSSAPTCS